MLSPRHRATVLSMRPSPDDDVLSFPSAPHSYPPEELNQRLFAVLSAFDIDCKFIGGQVNFRGDHSEAEDALIMHLAGLHTRRFPNITDHPNNRDG